MRVYIIKGNKKGKLIKNSRLRLPYLGHAKV